MALLFFKKKKRKLWAAPGKKLSAKARRALEEAAERRTDDMNADSDGCSDNEPTRYGDWESGGRCSDF